MQIVVNSLLADYTLAGKGKLVLLLHGWGDTKAGLEPLASVLQSDHEVLSIDLPGFGKTQAPPETWGLDDYAAFVGALLEKLHKKPYAIVGHSNGGAIALRGLRKANFSAEKLVLLASAGIRGEYKGRVKAIRLATKAGKLLTAPLPARVKQRLRRKVYTTVGSDMLVAEHLQETFKKVVTDDVRDDAKMFRGQTLLLYGTEDVSTPPSFGEKLQAALPHARLELIPGADHFLLNSARDLTAAKVQEFIKR